MYCTYICNTRSVSRKSASDGSLKRSINKRDTLTRNRRANYFSSGHNKFWIKFLPFPNCKLNKFYFPEIAHRQHKNVQNRKEIREGLYGKNRFLGSKESDDLPKNIETWFSVLSPAMRFKIVSICTGYRIMGRSTSLATTYHCFWGHTLSLVALPLNALPRNPILTQRGYYYYFFVFLRVMPEYVVALSLVWCWKVVASPGLV